jgi:hypothetical protein
VPQRTDPGIVACSFIISGLRVFDIHDPVHPKEIAYFNPPSKDVVGATNQAAVASSLPNLYVCRLSVLAISASNSPSQPAAAAAPPSPPDTFGSFPQAPFYGSTLTHWAMSAPTFVPSRNEVWYSDGMYGFYVVRLTNGVWSPVVEPAGGTTDTDTGAGTGTTATVPPSLARTGWTTPGLLIIGLFAFGLGTARVTAAARR